MRHARDRGAAAVEAALVLPLLLMLVFGIIDFGRMLNTQLSATEAAREGARLASLGFSQSQVESRVQQVARGARADVSSCPTTPNPATDARVEVRVGFEFVTPIAVLAGFFGGRTTISATGVMPCHG